MPDALEGTTRRQTHRTVAEGRYSNAGVGGVCWIGFL
jgi:hypothetical protein